MNPNDLPSINSIFMHESVVDPGNFANTNNSQTINKKPKKKKSAIKDLIRKMDKKQIMKLKLYKDQIKRPDLIMDRQLSFKHEDLDKQSK